MNNFSIIQKSQLEGATRIDAEYYQPEYLELAEKLRKTNIIFLRDYAEKINRGCQPIYDNNEKILAMKSVYVRNDFLDDKCDEFVSKNFYEKNKKSQIKKFDVLLNSTGIGTLGRSNYYYLDKKAVADGHVTIIRTREKLNPIYLDMFLKTGYGQFQISRLYSGSSGQIEIYPGDIGSIEVFLPNFNEQKNVADICEIAHDEEGKSKLLYQQAENLLLEELGLKDFNNEEKLSSIVNFSDIELAHRIDAEYFQPEYTQIIEKIEKYNDGWDLVGNQFEQNATLSKKKGEYCNYIEIGDINITSGEITPNKIETKNLPANGKIELLKNDLLVSKVRPYRGAVSFVDFEPDNLLGSGAFTVLQEKTNYKKEVLMVFLKTKPIKDLLLRYNCGTSYPVIKDEDILNLKIPLLSKETQEKISDLVKKSFESRKKSKELLEKAKRKVEEMIEK